MCHKWNPFVNNNFLIKFSFQTNCLSFFYINNMKWNEHISFIHLCLKKSIKTEKIKWFFFVLLWKIKKRKKIIFFFNFNFKTRMNDEWKLFPWNLHSRWKIVLDFFVNFQFLIKISSIKCLQTYISAVYTLILVCLCLYKKIDTSKIFPVSIL